MNVMVASIETRDTDSAPALPRRPGRWKQLVAISLAALMAAGFGVWLYRGPAIPVAVVTRGAAAEIVYATGAVEPETWSRSTPLVRGSIIAAGIVAQLLIEKERGKPQGPATSP